MTADEKLVRMARKHMQSLPEVIVPTGYRVRLYRTGEAGVWTEIIREAEPASDVTDSTFGEAFPGDEATRMRRIFFAEDGDGRPVGTVAAWHGEEGPEGGGSVKILWLAILPAHRKRGLGRALLTHALREMAFVHTDAVVTTGTSHVAGIRLLLDAGFVPGIENKKDRHAWLELAKIVAHPRLDENLNPPALPPASDGVVAELKAAAIPLAGYEAGRGLDDLRRLRKIVGDARIVSMGEATHGTREFFQLKHRLLEWLVVEMGFTAFAIEASFPECLMLDRFVTTGEGDPLDGITNMRFWTVNWKEVLEMVRWMRRHNEHAARQVRFYGFDMQFPALAVRDVIRSLRACAPDRAAALEPRLTPFAHDVGVHYSMYPCLPKGRRRAFREALGEARDVIRASAWSDSREQALACLHATVAVQGVDYLDHGAPSGFRDRAMAENVRALLDLEGPEGRIALWAHNGHVAKSGGEGMGRHLDQWFGKKHVVFGFAFGNGSFQAMDMNAPWGLRGFTAPPPPVGSLDETLLRTGLPLLALDLSAIPPESEAGKWMREPRVTRSGAGSDFSDDPEDTTWFVESGRIGELYDALLFVAETTAARPNPDERRLTTAGPAAPLTVAPRPAMTRDYAASMAEGLPRNWITRLTTWRPGYDCIVEGGTACLRREGEPWNWGCGLLQRAFDAASYRGKRIRLTAEGRIAVPGEWDRAYLAVGAHKGDDTWPLDCPSDLLAFAATLDEPWMHDAWETRSLAIDVPAKADTITFAFWLAGNGSAWIRSIRLDQVP